MQFYLYFFNSFLPFFVFLFKFFDNFLVTRTCSFNLKSFVCWHFDFVLYAHLDCFC